MKKASAGFLRVCIYSHSFLKSLFLYNTLNLNKKVLQVYTPTRPTRTCACGPAYAGVGGPASRYCKFLF